MQINGRIDPFQLLFFSKPNATPTDIHSTPNNHYSILTRHIVIGFQYQ